MNEVNVLLLSALNPSAADELETKAKNQQDRDVIEVDTRKLLEANAANDANHIVTNTHNGATVTTATTVNNGTTYPDTIVATYTNGNGNAANNVITIDKILNPENSTTPKSVDQVVNGVIQDIDTNADKVAVADANAAAAAEIKVKQALDEAEAAAAKAAADAAATTETTEPTKAPTAPEPAVKPTEAEPIVKPEVKIKEERDEVKPLIEEIREERDEIESIRAVETQITREAPAAGTGVLGSGFGDLTVIPFGGEGAVEHGDVPEGFGVPTSDIPEQDIGERTIVPLPPAPIPNPTHILNVFEGGLNNDEFFDDFSNSQLEFLQDIGAIIFDNPPSVNARFTRGTGNGSVATGGTWNVHDDSDEIVSMSGSNGNLFFDFNVFTGLGGSEPSEKFIFAIARPSDFDGILITPVNSNAQEFFQSSILADTSLSGSDFVFFLNDRTNRGDNDFSNITVTFADSTTETIDVNVVDDIPIIMDDEFDVQLPTSHVNTVSGSVRSNDSGADLDPFGDITIAPALSMANENSGAVFQTNGDVITTLNVNGSITTSLEFSPNGNFKLEVFGEPPDVIEFQYSIEEIEPDTQGNPVTTSSGILRFNFVDFDIQHDLTVQESAIVPDGSGGGERIVGGDWSHPLGLVGFITVKHNGIPMQMLNEFLPEGADLSVLVNYGSVLIPGVGDLLVPLDASAKIFFADTFELEEKDYYFRLLGSTTQNINDSLEFIADFENGTFVGANQELINVFIEDDAPIAVDDSATATILLNGLFTITGNLIDNDKPGADTANLIDINSPFETSKNQSNDDIEGDFVELKGTILFTDSQVDFVITAFVSGSYSLSFIHSGFGLPPIGTLDFTYTLGERASPDPMEGFTGTQDGDVSIGHLFVNFIPATEIFVTETMIGIDPVVDLIDELTQIQVSTSEDPLTGLPLEGSGKFGSTINGGNWQGGFNPSDVQNVSSQGPTPSETIDILERNDLIKAETDSGVLLVPKTQEAKDFLAFTLQLGPFDYYFVVNTPTKVGVNDFEGFTIEFQDGTTEFIDVNIFDDSSSPEADFDQTTFNVTTLAVVTGNLLDNDILSADFKHDILDLREPSKISIVPEIIPGSDTEVEIIIEDNLTTIKRSLDGSLVSTLVVLTEGPLIGDYTHTISGGATVSFNSESYRYQLIEGSKTGDEFSTRESTLTITNTINHNFTVNESDISSGTARFGIVNWLNPTSDVVALTHIQSGLNLSNATDIGNGFFQLLIPNGDIQFETNDLVTRNSFFYKLTKATLEDVNDFDSFAITFGDGTTEMVNVTIIDDSNLTAVADTLSVSLETLEATALGTRVLVGNLLENDVISADGAFVTRGLADIDLGGTDFQDFIYDANTELFTLPTLITNPGTNNWSLSISKTGDLFVTRTAEDVNLSLGNDTFLFRYFMGEINPTTGFPLAPQDGDLGGFADEILEFI